ncbi:L-type lectin-domain containing receptor kinase SIT2-like [Cryptomeria japonica]|uniref:L-type lectin-domain containing receptor kinase SIT2-like n=1 Tax=Cryptomeria japonica TaxID=3369 RepID=UPI0025ABC51E|nr:L-type lectin-domain containing receptor kinase SIT2-like [Cryptomeria japonica]
MAGIPVVVVSYLLLHPWLSVSSLAQTTFVFPRLSGLTSGNLSALYLDGNAVTQPDLIGIRLTNLSQYVTGSVLYSEAVRMKERVSKNATLSFSTSFVFAMAPPNPLECAEGLSFMMTPKKTHEGGLPGSYLGLFNFTSMGQPYNHLFAVEFDIFRNAEFDDINDNHVGVNLNSLYSVESKAAGYWDGNQFVQLDLNERQNIQAWIDYDHLQQQLNVTIALAGSLRPETPLISKKNMSLSGILEEEMYVGFVAGTGGFVQEHYILAWIFTTNGTAPALNASILPILTTIESHSNNPKSGLILGLTAAFVCFVVLAVAVVWFKRKKSGEVIEEWELDYWPHRISYRDLAIATKRFGEKQVLGSGGFGKVYKGVLPANGLEIAVKAIFRETTEGVKEFIAEISSLGRLQHRNLVQIRGYCRRGGKLFIAYDFMVNGSLDKMIFGNPSRVLKWSQRYAILRDVGAGLLYLHEGWEQRVVHRDIKSSNVLLDSELRGKLGDFGLARLYSHDENSRTTHVVGTPGYIAPDLISTGKATSSTDVFSFGVLLLEVACGRRPVDPLLDPYQIILLDWVRDLYASDSLIDAADAKLGGDFVKDEMETVFKLGLFCTNPQPEGRPVMRQVVQILEGETSLAASALPLSFEISESGPIEESLDAFCSESLELPLNGSSF